jgi:hypothetical protein
MRAFLSLLVWLAAPAAFAGDADVRVLQAGDTTLRVEVIGVGDRARVELLQQWIAEVARMPRSLSGRFPLRNAEVRIRQVGPTDRDHRDPGPVPWGQTLRRDGVAVLLYVRADATLDELRDDWTAVHELSHLFHPYLGAHGRWLAEGLASYYQNVLRARAGLLEEEEAWRRLDAGFRRGRAASSDTRLDATGRQRGATMRIYWAGAAYWLEADLALRREHGSTLDAVLSAYARCCLASAPDADPQAFVAALDRIVGGDVFTTRYQRYAASTTFPSLDAAYRELGVDVSGAQLRFLQRRDALQLRHALMGASRAQAGRRDAGLAPG